MARGSYGMASSPPVVVYSAASLGAQLQARLKPATLKIPESPKRSDLSPFDSIEVTDTIDKIER